MSSVPYSGKKYASTWQIQSMTMNDGMKQTGIHKNNLVGIFILIFFFPKESFIFLLLSKLQLL